MCMSVMVPLMVGDAAPAADRLLRSWVKPTKTWGPGRPNSTKKGGSLALTQASMTGEPSMVEVCCQPWPVGG